MKNLRVITPCLVVTALLIVGCGGSINGNWHLDRALPSRQVFSMDNASFKSDGTFAATVTLDGRTLNHTGKYHFTGFKLTLMPKDGGQQTFDAYVKLNRTLELTDKDRHCVLARD